MFEWIGLVLGVIENLFYVFDEEKPTWFRVLVLVILVATALAVCWIITRPR